MKQVVSLGMQNHVFGHEQWQLFQRAKHLEFSCQTKSRDDKMNFLMSIPMRKDAMEDVGSKLHHKIGLPTCLC